MEQSSSEFAPETRRVWQVETSRLRGGGINRVNYLAYSPPQSYPSRAEGPQALARQAMAGRGYI